MFFFLQEGFLLGKTVMQTVQVNNDVQSDVPLEQKRIGKHFSLSALAKIFSFVFHSAHKKDVLFPNN